MHSIDIAVMVLHTMLVLLPGCTFEHAVGSKVSANRSVSEWNTHRTGAEEVLLMIEHRRATLQAIAGSMW